MYTLVLNCGSSSLKFALLSSTTKKVAVSGVAERLESPDAEITIKLEGERIEDKLEEKNHRGAVTYIFYFLKERGYSDKIEAVGHRVVHGAEYFKESIKITDETIKAIKKCNPLAPLHNPANLIGIEAGMEVLPHLPHVAVFDTSFHQTMPEKAFLYGLPLSLYRDHNVRRYGFHGSSHRFIAEKTAEILGKKKNEVNIISAHLGNGASIAAIKQGASIDTSMGMTPLEGLVMGTRSGTIDPGIFKYLADELQYSIDDIDNLLNKKSGLLGLSELSNDCRTLEEKALAGNEAAQLALEIFSYRIAKTIASYMAPLESLDALVFTGGIGENSDYVRKAVIKDLGFLGFTLDEDANKKCFRGVEGTIATSPNFGKILVVCTDEEAMIVRDTLNVIHN